MRMPRREARPEPTSRAVGVARPRAHGQATTNTVIALASAISSGLPRASLVAKAMAAIAMTAGTKTAETLSARRWTGAFPVCASVRSLPILARVVSSPTRTARTVRAPKVLTAPPVSLLPGPTSTGMDSPVRREASTADSPSTTNPSVAAVSPGRTRNSSPTSSSAASIVSSTTSPPSRRTRVAVVGARSSRERRASPALRRERDSSQRPRRRNVTMKAADSKYRCGVPEWPSPWMPVMAMV